jgi:hypothetical protein
MNETINVLSLAPAVELKPISQDLNIQKRMENLPGHIDLFELVVCPSSGLRAETDNNFPNVVFCSNRIQDDGQSRETQRF